MGYRTILGTTVLGLTLAAHSVAEQTDITFLVAGKACLKIRKPFDAGQTDL